MLRMLGMPKRMTKHPRRAKQARGGLQSYPSRDGRGMRGPKKRRRRREGRAWRGIGLLKQRGRLLRRPFWKAALLQNSGRTILSKPQQTRLNKRKAKHMANFFLQTNTQSPSIQAEHDPAEKRDDMADALLQTPAYSRVVLGIGPMPQQAEVLVID